MTAAFGGWPRRLLALTCLLLAGLSAVEGTHSSATAEPTTTVLISDRNLPVGTVLGASDVHTVSWPTRLRPSTALRKEADVAGRRLAGPLAVGDVLTAERLVGADLGTNLARGFIAAPVPLADAGSTNLIRAGDFVDLLSAAGADAVAEPAQVVASGVLVLAVVPGAQAVEDADGELIVAVDRATELRIAQVAGRQLLATVANPP
jgi:Flp pilus assembly protein CpaB